MSQQKLLELLKRELEFLNTGGYARCAHSPWRPPFIFEDSPSCANSSDKARPNRCEDCWLLQFVARDFRNEQVPCRFVELTSNGVTVDTLYRYATRSEMQEEVRRWLKERIEEIEAAEAKAREALTTDLVPASSFPTNSASEGSQGTQSAV